MLSFVVPAFNEERELSASLEAIRAAAEDADHPFEIIVVDDASTDATADIARRAGAHVIPVNFRQIAAVRNAGGRAAVGDVLFFVDADTHILPSHVTEALAAVAAGSAGGGARADQGPAGGGVRHRRHRSARGGYPYERRAARRHDHG